jgi:hypothetical protein
MHAIASPKPHYTLDVYERDEPVEHETYRVDEGYYPVQNRLDSGATAIAVDSRGDPV